MFVPLKHSDAEMPEPITPKQELPHCDIVIPKTSCSVFQSTNVDYVLKNLGTTQLIVVGQLTNQCVESAVRDACDMGIYICRYYELLRYFI